MKHASADRNCVWGARMLRAVSAALRGTMSGPSNTYLPKTTRTNARRPAIPATFAAMRCELSILLVVISFCSDGHLSVRVTFFQIADCILCLTNLVSAVDDWRDFSGLHEIAQNIQLVFGQFRNVEDKLLAGEV